MMDFENAKAIVLQELGQIETIYELSTEEKEQLKYNVHSTYLSVDTEFLGKEGVVQSITFHIHLPMSFPMVMPKISLPVVELEKYRSFPHIDEKGGICLFDDDTTRTNPENPVGILLSCLRRAKEIIEQGLAKTNYNDYKEEFLVYWLYRYNGEPDLDMAVLQLFSGDPDPAKVNMIKLDEPLHLFSYVVHQNDENATTFLNYLGFRKLSYKDQPICHLGPVSWNYVPPFNLRNKDVKQIVSRLPKEVVNRFKNFINSGKTPKFLTASVLLNGRYHLIGWRHADFKVVGKRKGFRNGKITNYELLSSLQANDPVVRTSPQEYSPDQKQLRSIGKIFDAKGNKKFLVAGLGSIGSNLIYFLNTYNDPEFRLVDPDDLSLDNINRHLLGFIYSARGKAVGVKSYLIHKNPFQKVEYRKESVLDVMRNAPEFVNNADYIFIAIGKTNIEQYLGSLVESGKITKPMFILWVEPYLSAGHAVYLHPGSRPFRSYFEDYELFKYNVVHRDAYLSNHPLLHLKQAGCQTTYVPYGMVDITLFLSGIFPYINKIISHGRKDSCALSWVGDLDQLRALNIPLSDFATSVNERTITIHEG
ncbi:hypothetical protein GO495_19860 [Chitinophaga oryziterrae]|uniref:Uncharacterized protein n=1 Tax=Chitinophaga oryziterrae TaxID=1031224 RepID=A0A6N8JEG3_9BACT|nr:E2/UBC family protein [Chitinophaga oryziterrae]MVT42861.1 hypothetical protein [Chitinophaga oryziterrae]